MKLKHLVGQCGTIEVRVAPLLLLIGAVVNGPHSFSIEDVIEMLAPEGGGDADS